MHVNMRFFQCILRIPAVSFASKSCPWETSDAPIESQTPTECGEIAFAQNELVAPEKKPNQKIEKEKKSRDALLRSSQVRKLLNAGGKPSTKFPPDGLDEKARVQASSSQAGGAKPHVELHKRRVRPCLAIPFSRVARAMRHQAWRRLVAGALTSRSCEATCRIAHAARTPVACDNPASRTCKCDIRRGTGAEVGYKAKIRGTCNFCPQAPIAHATSSKFLEKFVDILKLPEPS
jgi:hypothetical protein